MLNKFKAACQVIGIRKAVIQVVVYDLLKARWITNSNNELGFRICGVNFWYYKHPEPIIGGTATDDDFYRTITKREFGEVVRSTTKDKQ
jgi:hypothetical protein